MPPRKVSGGRQATLSFNHRVTKAVPKQSAKEAVLLSKKVDSKEKEAEKIETVIEKEAEKAKKVEKKAEKTEEPETVDDEPLVEEAQQLQAPKAIRAPLEIEADSIPDSQIHRYWRSIEAQSLSRPVHQDGMGLGEKVLRHFDVSSQFGVSFILRLDRRQSLTEATALRRHRAEEEMDAGTASRPRTAHRGLGSDAARRGRGRREC